MDSEFFEKYSDEPRLKEVIADRLSIDFDIRAEVEGQFIVDGTSVFIDYLLFPKPALVEKGFVEDWVGLEVKHPKNGDNKPIKFAWQCITYSQSKFNNRRPPFVLMFPSITFFLC